MGRKVCVVIPSRSDYGSIKPAVQAIKDHPDLDLQLIVSGAALLERFGYAVDCIKQDGFTPDEILYVVVEGDNPLTMVKTTGLAIVEMGNALNNLKPDVVLSVGDRYETIATAIAASYMNIPVAQTMCGETSGTIDEHVRHAITKLVHIHFPATKLAEQRVLQMGEDPKHVFMVGCPRIDMFLDMPTYDSFDLFHKFMGVGGKFSLDEPFLLALQHAVSTEYGQARRQVEETLAALDYLHIPTIMIWPNIDAGHDALTKGIRTFREHYDTDSYLHLFKNLPPDVYAYLMTKCACMVGNSSSAIREASFVGTPSVNIGTRQTGREQAGNVINVGHSRLEIIKAIEKQVRHGRYEPSELYGDGHAGARIADVLATCELNIDKRMTY